MISKLLAIMGFLRKQCKWYMPNYHESVSVGTNIILIGHIEETIKGVVQKTI